MLDASQILEKAQKNVERQIVLLKEELAAKESAKNNCRQNGSIPDMSEYAKKMDVLSIPTPPTTGTYFLVSVNGVMTWVETDVTSILKVAELPETPIDTTMYAVVEEEATTASETDSEV